MARFGTHTVLRRAVGGAVALSLLVAPASAQACVCAAIAPETQLQQSDAAVIVRLVDVVRRGRYTADLRYRVQEVFKGKRRLRAGRLLTLHTATNNSCALPRREGRRYGLFLHRARGRWHASLCDVTSPRTMREAASGAGRSERGC